MVSDNPPPDISDVIRRLPPGVDYTRIKQILLSAPPPLTVLLWASRSDDRVFALFRGKTYRAIDRELLRREQTLPTLPPEAAEKERSLLTGLRHQLIVQLAGEAIPGGSKKFIDARLVDPTRLDPQRLAIWRQTRLDPHRQAIVLTVGKPARRAPKIKIIDERIIASEPRLMSHPEERAPVEVEWLDPDRISQAWMELLRKHFPGLFGRRSGRDWRTNRPAVGWPLIAQHLVPALYEYLKPFYPARPYHFARGRVPTAGHFPTRLLRDMANVLRCELPYAGGLTVQRVKAAIQRYITQQQAQRSPLAR